MALRGSTLNLLELAGGVESEPSATAVIALRRLADASRFGVVEIEKDWITKFSDRPQRSDAGSSAAAFKRVGAF
jgi:dTDP-glucose pyrophosphorylase